MRIDPFAIKRHSKLHPARLGFTGYARAAEIVARAAFPMLKIRTVVPENVREVDKYPHNDTAVTPPQMAALLDALSSLPAEVPGAVAEIGSYRGITTRQFALATNRTVYAIDPYQGYGGAEADLAAFNNNTGDLSNVVHLRDTSGGAVERLTGQLAFAFVDAVHDYVNTAYDATIWSERLTEGGLLAMHDVDNPRYAGTHLAAWRMSRLFELVCHIEGLVIVRKG